MEDIIAMYKVIWMITTRNIYYENFVEIELSVFIENLNLYYHKKKKFYDGNRMKIVGESCRMKDIHMKMKRLRFWKYYPWSKSRERIREMKRMYNSPVKIYFGPGIIIAGKGEFKIDILTMETRMRPCGKFMYKILDYKYYENKKITGWK